jgi:hypothetical protein
MTLDGPADLNYPVVFSPDGRQVAVETERYDIIVFETDPW